MARARFAWSAKDARAIMASRGVQRQLRQCAEKRGVPAFRAAAPKKSGAFARNVQVVDARGWDGRPGVRIVAFPDRRRKNSPIAIEFGAHRARGANATQAAIAAIGSGRRRR